MNDIKPDEKLFFSTCFILRSTGMFTIRDIVNMFSGLIHHKRCWYLLKKWGNKGFYNWGVTLDLGWFEPENLPERYQKCIVESLALAIAMGAQSIGLTLKGEKHE